MYTNSVKLDLINSTTTTAPSQRTHKASCRQLFVSVWEIIALYTYCSALSSAQSSNMSPSIADTNRVSVLRS